MNAINDRVLPISNPQPARLTNADATLRGQIALTMQTWRRVRHDRRFRSECLRTGRDLETIRDQLCKIRHRMLKRTGVSRSEHKSIENAIIQLSHAIDEYRGPEP